MAKAGFGRNKDTIFFNWPEVATALIRLREIHTGWWKISVGLNVTGVNINHATGPATFAMMPGAALALTNVHLIEVPSEKVDPLCVNAEVVNPRKPLIVMPSLAVN